MSDTQNNLKEQFNNYRKSLNVIKNDLIEKIKQIRKKDDTQKISKILENMDNKS